jgi:hypothetical protein
MSFGTNSAALPQLKKHWLRGVVLSVVGTILAVAVVTSAFSDYSGSCSGPGIACGISDAITVTFWTAVACLAAGVILLRLLVTTRTVLAAYSFLLSVIPVAILTSPIANNIVPRFINFDSSGYDFALTALILSLIILPIEIKLFAARLEYKSWAFGIPLALVQILLIWLILPRLVSIYNNRHNQAEELKKMEALHIQLYEPLGLIAGSKNGYSGVNSGEVPGRPDYYETEFYVPASYKIYQLEATNLYNPPRACIIAVPDYTGGDYSNSPCQDLGMSKSGCEVYYSQVETADRLSFASYGFCKIDKTLIGTESGDGHVAQDQVKFIFDNLKPASAKELQSLKL